MDYLIHHGIKGMKWGVRRYQNADGSYTPEGRKRYSRDRVFISGSSKTQDKTSGYYRKNLPKSIKSEIDSYMRKRDTILVGDAPGIDRQVQNYLKSKNYKKVVVYSPGNKARYLADKKWKNKLIDASEFEPMSPEWLRKKDIAMTNDATKGLAVILDNGATATRNNVNRLMEQGKNAVIFELSGSGRANDRYIEKLK